MNIFEEIKIKNNTVLHEMKTKQHLKIILYFILICIYHL